MNKNDSSIISHLLQNEGMREVDNTDQADIVIINTCSVREHAEQRALGHIATLRSWREQRGKVLAIVGCMAQRRASMLTTEYPFIDLVLGPDAYRSIVQFINNTLEHPTRISETQFSNELYNGVYPTSSAICDYVSIMRGCNNYCSYCVVPYVRGSARSRSVSDIIAQIASMVQNGVKDITLLGQNVSEYQYTQTDFANLLHSVAHVPGVCRIRFLTSHPKDLNQKTIQTVAHEQALCEWFHLPMQSGNSRILELMNRQYTIEQYKDLVQEIRRTIPTATITTDIIVGFPTETEQEYQDTINAVRAIQFDDAYMYGYSPRSETRAFQYEPLPEGVIKSRLAHLIKVQSEVTKEKLNSMRGRTYEVLFEEPAKHGGFRGKTRGNRDVIIQSNFTPGAIAYVLIDKIQGRTPIGSIV